MKMTCSSFLYKFTPRDQDRLVTLVSKYSRAGHEQTTVKNCKYVIVEIAADVSDNTSSLRETLDLQLDAIAFIFPLVKDRFSSPGNEVDCPKNAPEEIAILMREFQQPLDSAKSLPNGSSSNLSKKNNTKVSSSQVGLIYLRIAKTSSLIFCFWPN